MGSHEPPSSSQAQVAHFGIYLEKLTSRPSWITTSDGTLNGWTRWGVFVHNLIQGYCDSLKIWQYQEYVIQSEYLTEQAKRGLSLDHRPTTYQSEKNCTVHCDQYIQAVHWENIVAATATEKGIGAKDSASNIKEGSNNAKSGID